MQRCDLASACAHRPPREPVEKWKRHGASRPVSLTLFGETGQLALHRYKFDRFSMDCWKAGAMPSNTLDQREPRRLRSFRCPRIGVESGGLCTDSEGSYGRLDIGRKRLK